MFIEQACIKWTDISNYEKKAFEYLRVKLSTHLTKYLLKDLLVSTVYQGGQYITARTMLIGFGSSFGLSETDKTSKS